MTMAIVVMMICRTIISQSTIGVKRWKLGYFGWGQFILFKDRAAGDDIVPENWLAYEIGESGNFHSETAEMWTLE